MVFYSRDAKISPPRSLRSLFGSGYSKSPDSLVFEINVASVWWAPYRMRGLLTAVFRVLSL